MKRLDTYLTEALKISRERAQVLIEDSGIKVNSKLILKSSFKIKEGDEVVVVKELEPKKTSLTPSKLPIDIVFEDDFFLIINKQAGVSTHPPSINGEGTIANGIVNLIESTGLKGMHRPGIVHRLDKDTTGLLIIAKTDDANTKISNLIAKRDVERRYIAICYGTPKLPTFQIKTNIERDGKIRTKMQIVKQGGKEAVTNIQLKKKLYNNEFCLLELKLETGRTHQIRLHLEHIKQPIVGDLVYGLKPPSFFERFKKDEELYNILINTKRQMLHAFSLKFIHPFTNKEMHLITEPPKDFKALLKKLES